MNREVTISSCPGSIPTSNWKPASPRVQTSRGPLSLTGTINYNAPPLTRISLLLLAFIVTSPGLSANADTIPIPHGARHYAVGPAPLFSLTNMDSEKLALRDSRGHWVFVHFWASWCGPCREEMPAVQKVATLLANEPLQITMINTVEDDDTVFEFLSSFAPDTDSLMDAGWSGHRSLIVTRPACRLPGPIRKASFATRHQGCVRGTSRNSLNSCAAC